MSVRQSSVLWFLFHSLFFISSLAHGQSYPSKVIRIVTLEAGGGTDLISRVIAQGLAQSVGQQVVVENRPGTGIAADYVAKAAPDGHTLHVGASVLWLWPFLTEKASYDPVRDFAPISLTHKAYNLIVVHPSLPVNSVRELIALAKQKPGEIDYASANAGSGSHLATELFKVMAGVDLRRIPYKGSVQAINGVLSGDVKVIFAPATAVAPHARAGRLRAIAVTGGEMSALYPGVPSASADLPGYNASSVYGVFAPAKTPAAIVTRLNQEIVRTLNTSDARERFSRIGIDTVGSTPEEFAAAIKADMTTMGKLIRDIGIRAD